MVFHSNNVKDIQCLHITSISLFLVKGKDVIFKMTQRQCTYSAIVKADEIHCSPFPFSFHLDKTLL